MSDQVVTAVITVIAGGLITGGFAVFLRLIDRKAERAKDEITRNSAEVSSARDALEGMEILLRNQRIESDRKDAQIEEQGKTIKALRDRIEAMSKDLIEEKSISRGFDRELRRRNKKE